MNENGRRRLTLLVSAASARGKALGLGVDIFGLDGLEVYKVPHLEDPWLDVMVVSGVVVQSSVKGRAAWINVNSIQLKDV